MSQEIQQLKSKLNESNTNNKKLNGRIRSMDEEHERILNVLDSYSIANTVGSTKPHKDDAVRSKVLDLIFRVDITFLTRFLNWIFCS